MISERPSLSTRIFLKVLERAQHGTVEIELPDGNKQSFGVGETRARVSVLQWSVFDSLFKRGDLALAEAIIEGQIIVDDVAALVEWACLNDRELSATFQGKWYGILAHRLKHFLARNTRKGAEKNIHTHYDLGNEFYRLWLDSSMTYSSALYLDEQDTDLQAAQMRKYDRIIEMLDIRASDHVLEIGCGWGGFFSRAVERTGCKVTAVMNSSEQSRHNRELIQAKGFGKQIDLRQMDYRDISGKFDKVVSIEMIEAVGERYWGAYFSKLSSSLKQKGKSMIQGITIRDDLFYSYRNRTDFIQQYVFPGGMLLSPEILSKRASEHRLAQVDRLEFPNSYARTLRMWRESFNLALNELKTMGFDDKFIRLWNLYLSYCEGAFRAGRISVGQYLFES